MSRQPAEIARINMELSIDREPARVWAALTDNIGDWWPAEFYAGGEAGARDFQLEAWPGGRMFETWKNGGGALWGSVITVEPRALLQVLGSLFPNWGGPSQWYATWELKPNGKATVLTFSESSIGLLSDSGTAQTNKGWQFLWQSLKAHVEDKPPPAWRD